jgi:hypothetical protein
MHGLGKATMSDIEYIELRGEPRQSITTQRYPRGLNDRRDITTLPRHDACPVS